MAWLENRKGGFRVCFRYGGRMYHLNLNAENEKEAQALVGRVEENLIVLERGEPEPPNDREAGLFLIYDGKINSQPKIAGHCHFRHSSDAAPMSSRMVPKNRTPATPRRFT